MIGPKCKMVKMPLQQTLTIFYVRFISDSVRIAFKMLPRDRFGSSRLLSTLATFPVSGKTLKK